MRQPPSIHELSFESCSVRCAATLHLPERDTKPPVVVMAHGFGGEQSFRLPHYARLFSERGLAVLLFDYRFWGKSEGTPRNLVSYQRQLNDWRAACEFTRSLPDVDGERMALWGSSYSGGHVLVMGAELDGISAIVSQAPMVDMLSSAKQTEWSFKAKSLFHACLDIVKQGLLGRPHYIKVVGQTDEFAVMNRPGCWEGYQRLIPEDQNWPNRCAARELLFALRYRPLQFADRIPCPVHIVIADADQLIPAHRVEKTASRLRLGDRVHWPGDHFSVYHGEGFATLAPQQADFLARQLLAARHESSRSILRTPSAA